MPHATRPLSFYARLSIAAALATMALKGTAWLLTGSVGLLSDAMESLVNLAGAVMALWMLGIAARPADAEHAFGHSKAEYFASGFEGFLIMGAACAIAWAGAQRLLAPAPLHDVGLGLLVSLLASAINGAVGLVLLRAARQHRSIALEADARHLFADVWTSAAVLLGLLAAWASSWWWLDPLLALLVAVHIVREGLRLVQRSVSGLMDQALPPHEIGAIERVLDTYRAQGIAFHALRTRQAGARSFAAMHVLVPGAWTVQQGHDLLHALEAALQQAVPQLHVITHLEPIEDPASFNEPGL
ncbi:cation diffusion facilitator family transporter [Vandammella animalimorsus]|uniref:cation diffusion facilitator family transporter n=1 Tax=Vandammella animalimorsus TaxID=2029117 RepID=UPI00325A6EAB